VAIVGAVVGIRMWLRTPAGRLRWDTAKLHLPLGVGRTIRKFALARWARTLAELHSAGVPQRRSLKVAGNAAGNAAVCDASAQMQQRLQAGAKLSQALAEHPVFGHEVVAMVRTAEDSSAVTEMLGHIAELYDKESEAAVDTMIPTFQFAMYGLAAAAIMLTALVMYIPMIEMIGRLAQAH
jgi:type II secretory pathway component PulF